MSDLFKVYVADGQEYFVYNKNDKPTKVSFPFSQSLLDLLYLDMSAYDDMFAEMSTAVQKLYTTRDDRFGERVKELLEGLSKVHIYFEFMLVDWTQRLDDIRHKDNIGIMELLPYKKKLAQCPNTLRAAQAQIRAMLEQVLDITTPDKPISEKMVKYSTPKDGNDERIFRFTAQTTTLEIIDKKTFCEVLYPSNIYDIIEFFARECVKREQRFRICKNCDKYFALTGYINAEYCDRVFDEQGHTCKEMGALNVWQKKAKKPAYELYSKEYKKRFARIKYGKISKEDFYAWAEKAREMRDKCMADEMEYEKFQEWIAVS
ncbi:MAG: DUF6076 domain-containing protein [Angelakisella sp.]